MSAKPPSDPDAGEWVAYREEPSRNGGRRRIYLLNPGAVYVSTTVTRKDAIRFDTRTEALAAARQVWPMKAAGYVKGAEHLNA